MAGRLRASSSASVDCLLPPVPFTKRERQAARLHRVSLQRDSVRHNSNCRSPRPRPGRDRRACARRAYGGVGPAPPVGGSPPPFLSPHAFVCLFSWPTHRSSAFQWGRLRFHPSTYPEPYRHGISLRENTDCAQSLPSPCGALSGRISGSQTRNRRFSFGYPVSVLRSTTREVVQ